MANQLFQLLADRMIGTNVSGLNGNDVTVSQDHYDYLVRHNQALLKEVEALTDEVAVLNSASERSESFRLKLKEKNRISALEGSDDIRISQFNTARNFIRQRINDYVKSIGETEGLDLSSTARFLSPKQRYICNLYVIAAADYLVMSNYTANLIAAVEQLIHDYESGETTYFEGTPGYPDKIYKLHDKLVSNLVILKRLDGDIFKQWHKLRVEEIAHTAVFIKGTRQIDPKSIPPLMDDEMTNLMDNRLVEEIRLRIAAEARNNIIHKDSNDLIPSAFVSNAYDVSSLMLPI